MKKLLLVSILALTSLQSAYAFQVRAHVNFNQLEGRATVVNHFNRPIVCDLNAEGVTRFGQSVYSYMNQVMLYPGQNAYTYVYTNYNNPFVNVRANANCYWY